MDVEGIGKAIWTDHKPEFVVTSPYGDELREAKCGCGVLFATNKPGRAQGLLMQHVMCAWAGQWLILGYEVLPP